MNSILQAFASRRMLTVLLLGFSSGLPLALTGGTLQAWMASEKVDLTTIGIFALVGLPYTLKFLWSPLMDRYVPPFLGRRRGWMLVCQGALVAMISAMGFSDPTSAPAMLAFLAFMTAFFSASQDIVVDAYRTEVLEKTEYGIGAGIYIMGYRLAMLVSGALALILSDHLSWREVYLLMAGAMLVGITATWIATEPTVSAPPPKSISEAVIDPFVEYFKRSGAVEILCFILLYKLGDVLTGAMTTPFMIQLGFTRTDIGAVNKGFGLVATIVGGLAGGALMLKLGLKRSLWAFGFLQAVSNLMFLVLAVLGLNYPAMVAAIAVENLSGGLGTAAFSAFLMSQCNQRFTATQYALLTSFMAFARVWMSAPSGKLAEVLGWQSYFLACTLLAVPGMLLLLRYDRWQIPKS